MRLSSVGLHKTLADALETQCGIRTDCDLLFGPSTFELYTHLLPGTVALAELEQYVLEITQLASAAGNRADTQLSRDLNKVGPLTYIETGLKTLDGMIHNDTTNVHILEISGDSGSGKTAFALHIMLHALSKDTDCGALWVDTTGEFSADRVEQLLENHHGKATSTVLERLQISIAFDLPSTYATIEDIGAFHNSNAIPNVTTRYVVIDNMSTIFGQVLNAGTTDGHSSLMAFMRRIREISQSLSAIFIIINPSTKTALQENRRSVFSADTKMKPSLGTSFTFMPDCTIWLSRTYEGPSDHAATHVAEILRSRAIRTSRWCSFKSNNGFLFETGA